MLIDSFFNIDADEFKVLLLREALTDGSYESWVKPPEIHTLEAKGERFYPLELASLVHEESSLLASSLRQELIDEGINIIIDTVLSDVNVAIALGQQLADAEYRVTVIDVEAPFEVSEERIVHRWQLAMEEAEAGTADALDGRWVPSSYTRPLFDTKHGRSKSQDAAERLASTCPTVERFERYFTSLEEHQAARRENRQASPVQEPTPVPPGTRTRGC